MMTPGSTRANSIRRSRERIPRETLRSLLVSIEKCAGIMAPRGAAQSIHYRILHSEANTHTNSPKSFANKLVTLPRLQKFISLRTQSPHQRSIPHEALSADNLSRAFPRQRIICSPRPAEQSPTSSVSGPSLLRHRTTTL